MVEKREEKLNEKFEISYVYFNNKQVNFTYA